MLGRLKRWVRQRHYYLAKLGFYNPPRQPLANFPDGMCITRIANTGITAIDNFCTPEEARHFIGTAGHNVRPSVVVEGEKKLVLSAGRTSQDALMHLSNSDQVFRDVVFRAASVFGLPVTHCDMVSITRYAEGEYYKAHLDYDDSYFADRMYTCLIYLSELDDSQGGGTWFTRLNLLARPKLGRAICWVNTDPDGKRHPETHHAALPPVGADVEKWVVQLWFRGYPVNSNTPLPQPLAGIQGQPLSDTDLLPEGVRHSGALNYENAYSIPGGDDTAAG